MADQLGIVLFGELDINKTIKNINAQITQLESKLKNINLGLDINVKSAFKDIENITNQISKNTRSGMQEEVRLAEQIAKLREKSELKNQKIDRRDELKQSQAINKALEDQNKLEKDIAIWKEKQEINMKKMASNGVDVKELNKLESSLSKISAESVDAKNEMKLFENQLSRVNVEANKSSSGIAKMALSYFSLYDAFQLSKQAARSMVESVTDLDSSMISLKRVTSETEDTYNKLLKSTANTAMSLGTQIPDLINSITEFSKLGYSFEDAQKMATDATKYAIAGEMDLSTATEALSASFSVYKDEVKDASEITDLYNHIGNTMAITSEGIGVAMRDSANSLKIANNTISESVAMIAAANKTVIDPNKVANGLRVISMRLRSVSEEDGQYIAGMRENILQLTNGMVDIWDSATNQFKATYDILLEIGKVYKSLDDVNSAKLLETIAGKNRAEIAAAIISNVDDMKKGLVEAGNAMGSVDAEVEASMNSIEKKIEQTKIAFSELAYTTISGEFIKSIVDSTTQIIQLATRLGGMIPILSTIISLIVILKATSISSFIISIVKSIGSLGVGLNVLKANIVGSVMQMRGMQTAAAATSLTMSTMIPIIGALGLAMSGIAMYISYTNQQYEESVKIAKEGIVQKQEELKTTDELMVKYKELSESDKTNKEVREQLLDIQKQLADMHGIETRELDLLNKSYESNIDVIKKAIEQKQRLLEVDNSIVGKDLDDKLNDAMHINVSGNREDYNNGIKDILDNMSDAFDVYGRNGKFAIKLNPEMDSESALKSLDELLDKLELSGYKNTDIYNQVAIAYSDLSNAMGEVDEHRQKEIEDQKAIENANILEISSIEAKKNGINDLSKATTDQVLELERLYVAQIAGEHGYAAGIEAQQKFREAIYGTNEAFDDYIDSIGDVNDAVDSSDALFTKISDSFSEFKEEATKSSDKVKLLNETINSLDEKQILTSDSIVELLDKFPALRKDVIKTGDTYTINRDALVDLRDQSIDTFNTMANNQRDAISDAAEAAKIRIANYRTEIDELRKLATAQSAMYAISNNNKKLMGYEGLTTDNQSSKLIAEKEKALLLDSGYKQAQQDLQKYLQLLDDLGNQEQDYLIKGNEANTKKGSNISNKKSKSDSNNDLASKLKDKIEKDKSAILKYGEDIQAAIERTKQKIELADLKGDTKLSETLNIELETLYSQMPNANKKMAEELRALKSKAIKEINSSALKSDEKLELIDDTTVDFDDEIAQQSTDWWDSTNQLIEHQLSLLEKRKEIMSEPLSDMELEISQHENKIKLLELENATMEEQVVAYNSLLESENLREEYLKLTIDDLYKQRSLLDSTSKQYKTLTEYILDFENQLTDSMQSQADAKEKIIDLMYDEMELSLEKSIYGNDGQAAWEKLNDKKIDSLNEELDVLKAQSEEKQKQADAEKRALELAELRTQLENAKKQKSTQEFKRQADGSWQWEYVADADKVADLEKQIREKELEEERIAEEEKQALKEKALQDEIKRLQNEAQAKSEFFNQSKEDLLKYLQDNKDTLALNGDEILEIVSSNMDEINGEFDTKMDLITNSLETKLEKIKALFSNALSIEGSVDSLGSGSSDGKPTYSNTGGSGKTYFQYGDGTIEVLRTDGTTSTVKPSDKNYSSTVSAMKKDKVKKRYKDGGLVTETGAMFLDGTKHRPEYVLNAEQTQAFVTGMENLPRFNFEMARLFGSDRGVSRVNPSNTSSTVSARIENVNVTLPNVRNGNDFVSELGKIATNLLNKSSLIPSGEY